MLCFIVFTFSHSSSGSVFFLLLTLLQMFPIPPLCLPLPSPYTPPLAFNTLLSMGHAYMHICSLANLFWSSHTLPSKICQAIPCIHATGLILFVDLFWSIFYIELPNIYSPSVLLTSPYFLSKHAPLNLNYLLRRLPSLWYEIPSHYNIITNLLIMIIMLSVLAPGAFQNAGCHLFLGHKVNVVVRKWNGWDKMKWSGKERKNIEQKIKYQCR